MTLQGAIESVAARLAQRFGLDDASIGCKLFMDCLIARQHLLSIPSLESYLERVMSDPGECDALGQAMLVSESWFDRDQAQFSALDQLLRSGSVKAPVVVWSAPCAAGEECYSLAARFIAAGFAHGDFTIIGLDLSLAVLAKARSALFPPSAWRSELALPPWLQQQANGMLKVAPAVTRSVSFQHSNLAQNGAAKDLPAPNIVFSRNFFVYLTAQARKQWLQTLVERLAPGASLFTGPAESVSAWDSRFAVGPLHPYAFQLRNAAEAVAPAMNGHVPRSPLVDAPARAQHPFQGKTRPAGATGPGRPTTQASSLALDPEAHGSATAMRRSLKCGAAATPCDPGRRK